MPVLIILGILSIYGVIDIYRDSQKSAPPKPKREMEQMISQMIGKSKKECAKIAKWYRR